jgi:hypothetical protein
MDSKKHMNVGTLQAPARSPIRSPIGSRIHSLAALLAGLVIGGTAAAQANPWYIGASQAFTQESNLFRAAEGSPATRDTYSTTSLLAGLDQPIGRHRLFGDLSVRAVRFDDNKQLDNEGGSLLAGLDWSAIDVLSGRVSFNGDRSLTRYGVDFGFTDTSTRVLQTSREFIARAQYGGASVLTVDGGFTRRELEFSVPSGNEFEQDTVSAGLRYRPSGGLTFGVAVRGTQGSYPFAVPVGTGFRADDFERADADFTVLWVASGASTVTARLSYTDEKHELLPARNIRGVTGALAWNYKPTGKLNLFADLIRDSGAESSFAGTREAGGNVTVNSSPLSTTYQLRGEFEALPKVQLLAQVRYLKRDLVNNVGDTGDDELTEARFGVNWTPLRSVLVGCTVAREQRDSSSVLSTSYTATTTRCLAQFRTQ